MVAFLLLACRPDGPPDARTYTGPLVLDAGCEPTDNVLRYACFMELAEAGPVAWAVLQDGLPVFEAETQPALRHEVVLWGLPPDTLLVWQGVSPIGTAAGNLYTESLPDGIGQVSLEPSGTPAALDHVMVPWQCGGQQGLMLAGSDGVIRWYEELPEAVAAFDWTDDDRVVVMLRDGTIRSVHASGAVQFEVGDLGLPVHHGLASMGDHTYVLNADRYGDYVVDGLFVLDSDGSVVENWELADHVAVSGIDTGSDYWAEEFPGAIDFSHANAVTADGHDHLLLSLRAPSAVVRIAADPSAPDFGAIDWMLTGVDGGSLSSSFDWTDGGGFFGQHHAQRHSSGGVTIFDNGTGRDDSRAVLLEVDEAQGVVTEGPSWSMGTRCANQGGAYELADGGMVATCNATATIHEFVAGEPDPVFIQQVGCTDGTEWFLQRAVPVAL